MSIEADLEAFRDVALEVEAGLNQDPEISEETCQAAIKELDEILFDVVGRSAVSVSGEVYLPDYDSETGVLRPSFYFTDEPALGASNGVHIVRKKLFRYNVYDESVAVGYSVHTGNRKHSSPVSLAQYAIFAFAPVATSQLHLPGRLVDQTFAEVLPEDDDQAAEVIDTALLNGPLDFNQLQELFSRFKNELEIDYYLAYLNSVASISDFRLVLKTVNLLDEDYDDLLDEDAVFSFSKPERFSQFVYPHEIAALCLQVDSAEYDGSLFVPLSSIVEVASMTYQRPRKNHDTKVTADSA